MSETLLEPEATALESAVAAIASPIENVRREAWAWAMSPEATADWTEANCVEEDPPWEPP